MRKPSTHIYATIIHGEQRCEPVRGLRWPVNGIWHRYYEPTGTIKLLSMNVQWLIVMVLNLSYEVKHFFNFSREASLSRELIREVHNHLSTRLSLYRMKYSSSDP